LDEIGDKRNFGMKKSIKMIGMCLLMAVVVMMAQVLVAQETDKININQASVDELRGLKGIGPKLAERIVQYREEHGPFKVPQDIMKVKGIGPKKWEANKDRISVE
jgi:competence protein ComEA